MQNIYSILKFTLLLTTELQTERCPYCPADVCWVLSGERNNKEESHNIKCRLINVYLN